MQEIIHKHKKYAITECGINIAEMGTNKSITMTGVNKNVTCIRCKEILGISDPDPISKEQNK